jgi:hypothetical protein
MANTPARVSLTDVGEELMAPGQPLPFRVLDNLGRLLLNVGQIVHTTRQMDTLLERGACVDEEELAEVRRARGLGSGPAPAARHRTWFDHFDHQVWALDDLLRALVREGAGLAPRLEAFATEHIALIDRQLDAALFIAMRQDDRRFALYALTHALHTATVVLLTARQLGWPAERVAIAVKAALTMNASIVELQARMAEQSDPPSKKQMEQIRAHPERSMQLLRDAGVADEEWLTAVQDHHERGGGSGYPRGLMQVGEVAHVLRAADVFTAKVTPRALRPALLPQVAARQLFQEEQGGPVAGALIKALGLYPPGDFVKLKNGETAVVVRRATAKTAVQAVALLGGTGKPLSGPAPRDTALPEYMISGPLADRSGLPRVLPEQVYGLLQ